MKKFKVFQFTDHNSGYYFYETDSISSARERAKLFPKAQIDGNGCFELYENGNKTEWSVKKMI